MIPVDAYRGHHVGVYGLGRTGLATARALTAGGALVHVWDDGEPARTAAQDEGLNVSNFADGSLFGYAALVLSPGVPLTHPEPHAIVKSAREQGCPVIGDMELFALANRYKVGENTKPVIAITGTNGKSTTTALLGHILGGAGRAPQIGGNIGRAVLDLAAPDEAGAYVLELSSYQIDLCHTFDADIAVLLNIAPDHLDRHGGMDGYVTAKRRLFDMQKAGHTAIVSVDDPHAASICAQLAGQADRSVIPISIEGPLGKGVFVENGTLMDALSGAAEAVLDLATLARLPGRHNGQNVAAAYAAARSLGVARNDIVAGLQSFPGLPHRLELVAEKDGVRFVNDSKATNADATQHALKAFDRIYWIAGGRAKTDGVAALTDLLEPVQRGYFFGECAARFADEVSEKIETRQFRTLGDAMTQAAQDARRDGGGTVLLSPAAASFDQFKDFEARGDAFKAAVHSWLEGDAA